MARYGLSRPPGPILRSLPPPHDRHVAGRLSGTLVLRLETPPGQYVSPATGRLALTGSDSDPVVAQEAARAAGVPVLPGSGIKGAVRTLYELLSFSCDPFLRHGGCAPSSCCDACSLFGRMSYAGRVSFGDAVPKPVPEGAPGAVQVEVQRVPVPWTPKAARTPGDFRLYDLGAATFLGAGRKVPETQPKVLSREVYLGTFETRMSFVNLGEDELGRLLLALGLAPDLSTGYFLRLGGVKYDGKGAVRVEPRQLRLARQAGAAASLSNRQPNRQEEEGDCQEACKRWIAAARSSPWAASFWGRWQDLAQVLAPRQKAEVRS